MAISLLEDELVNAARSVHRRDLQVLLRIAILCMCLVLVLLIAVIWSQSQVQDAMSQERQHTQSVLLTLQKQSKSQQDEIKCIGHLVSQHPAGTIVVNDLDTCQISITVNSASSSPPTTGTVAFSSPSIASLNTSPRSGSIAVAPVILPPSPATPISSPIVGPTSENMDTLQVLDTSSLLPAIISPSLSVQESSSVKTTIRVATPEHDKLRLGDYLEGQDNDQEDISTFK